MSGDTNNDGKLDLGEAWIYNATYQVTQADLNAGQPIVNTVAVTSTEVTTPVSDDATTTVTQTPALSVAKDVDLTTVSAPGPLAYTITVTNTGNVALNGVVANDTLPGAATATALTLVSGDTNNDGKLDLGEAWIYNATYQVTQADLNAGQPIVNTVAVTSTEVTTPVSDDATTTVTQTPALSVAKAVDLATVSAPGPLAYTITVTNTGNVALNGVVANDTLPGLRPPPR